MLETSMMTWTYYKQDRHNGVWSLFREDAEGHQEIFHRKNGWQRSDELWRRRNAGEVGQDDIISEEQAEAVIRALGTSG
jgi:hypothetical protein